MTKNKTSEDLRKELDSLRQKMTDLENHVLSNYLEESDALSIHDHYRHLTEASDDIAFVLDKEGCYLGIYGKGLKKLNLKNSDFIGKSPSKIFGDEKGEVHQKASRRALQGKDTSYEWNFETGNGLKTFRTTLTPIRKSGGRVTGIAGISKEITKLVETKLQLHQSEAKFRAIIQNSSDVILLTDGEGAIQYASPSVKRVTGYTPKEIIGKQMLEWLSPDEITEARELFNELLINPSKQVNIQLKIRHKNNRWIWVEANANNLLENTDINSIVVNYRDITDRKEIEERLNKNIRELRENEKLLEEQAEELNQTNIQLTESRENLQKLLANKDRFFSIIAHDLRNPFNTLLGLSEMVYKDIEEFTKEEIKNFVMSINSSASNVLKLVEDLLQWYRVQSGRVDFNPESFQVNEIVDEILLVHKELARKKNITIKNEIDDDLVVYADKNMVNMILRNLITNSIKFTPGSGKIRLKCSMEDGNARITVADNGIGISSEDMARLFKIEETFATKGTNNEGGSGLGLILCKEFIKINGGEISVTSEPDKGSEFCVTLPLSGDS